MITRDIAPVDGGGRIPQPVKPDANKNGQNNVGPTASQDMAAVMAQAGQVFYVPTQILPDSNNDRGHDNYHTSNKPTHKEKNNTTSNIHYPTTNNEFKVLSDTVNNWINSMKDDEEVTSGQVQDDRNVVLGAEDEVQSKDLPKVSYTSGTPSNDKVIALADSWADFISNFDFTDMANSKGMVAWAMMMNYVKSAIWASALTSGDIEALMEQFKAMIEQLKTTADTKKKLSIKQADQIGHQIDAIEKEGRAGINASIVSVISQGVALPVGMIGKLTENVKKDDVATLSGDEKRLWTTKKMRSNSEFGRVVQESQAKSKALTKMSDAAKKKKEIPTEVAAINALHKPTDARKKEGIVFEGTSIGGKPPIKINPDNFLKGEQERGDAFVEVAAHENKDGKVLKTKQDGHKAFLEGINATESYEELLKTKKNVGDAIDSLNLGGTIEKAVEVHDEAMDKVILFAAANKKFESEVDALVARHGADSVTADHYKKAYVDTIRYFEKDPKYSGYKKALESYTKDFENRTKVQGQTRQAIGELPKKDNLTEVEKQQLDDLEVKHTNNLHNGHNIELLTDEQKQQVKLRAQIEKYLLDKNEPGVDVHSKAIEIADAVDNQYNEYHSTEEQKAVVAGNEYNKPVLGSDLEFTKKQELFQQVMQEDGIAKSFTKVIGGDPATFAATLKANPAIGKKSVFEEMTYDASVDFQLRNKGLEKIIEAKRAEEESGISARAKSNPPKSGFESFSQALQTLSKAFDVSHQALNLAKERKTSLAEQEKMLISGERDASSQMLEGILQIMQKVLEALVQMNQNLRQTATQSAASLQISTF